jgi:hypothetical protein
MTDQPPPDLRLRPARIARRRQLEAAWQQRLAAGLSAGGLTLRCGESDRSAFSQLLVMLAEAERLGPLPAAVPVTDRAGQIHDFSVPDLRALLVAYGAAYQALWIRKARFHEAIEQAASPEAVAAIEITFP